MKPFNLEEAKAGKPVQLRNGNSVRIICFDAKSLLPIVCLVQQPTKDNNGNEFSIMRPLNGRYYTDSPAPFPESQYDLVMATKKKTWYVNIYDNNIYAYKTADAAKQNSEVGERASELLGMCWAIAHKVEIEL